MRLRGLLFLAMATWMAASPLLAPPPVRAETVLLDGAAVLLKTNSSELKELPSGTRVWRGRPEGGFTWDGDVLTKTISVVNPLTGLPQEEQRTREPIEVYTTDALTSDEQVRGPSPGCIATARQELHISLDDFVWLDGVNDPGTVVLPGEYCYVFLATGDWKNPTLTRTYDYYVAYGKTYVTVPHFSGVGGGWFMADSVVDPEAQWSYDDDAADNDTATYAGVSDWTGCTGYLELHLSAAMNCEKIRIWFVEWWYQGRCEVDLYYGGAWHNVYESPLGGGGDEGAWHEIDLGASYWVDKARVRECIYTTGTAELYLYELHFYAGSVTPPAITTNDASQVAATSARLNAYVDDGGNATCDVRFQYGTATGNYTTNTTWVNATYGTGSSPYADVANLSITTTYYFRAQIRNSNSTVDGGEKSFTTYTNATAPSNFIAEPTSTSVALSWLKGTGATETYIRAKAGGYPSGVTDGTLAYNGGAAVATYGGLSPGVNYYFRAWGASGSNYSATYTDVWTTTLAGGAADGSTVTPPGEPDDWTQTPAGLSNFPFAFLIEGVAEQWEVPAANAWLGLTLFLIMAALLFVFRESKQNSIVTLVVGILLLVTSGYAGIIPTWMVFVFIVAGVGGMFVYRRA